jgi:hypothetical protein
MKKVVLYLITIIFTANTVVVAAAYDTCLLQGMADHSYLHAEASMSESNKATCHEEQKQSVNNCEDACFCLAYSINNAPLFDNQTQLQHSLHYTAFYLVDEVLAAGYYKPLYRPPILIS